MELGDPTYELKHLDLMDPAREALYIDARHCDCEHYYGDRTCGNSCYVVKQLLIAAQECNPDADFEGVGLLVAPDPDKNACHCPGFLPSEEYQEDLRERWKDVEKMHREDVCRVAQMGRK